MTNHFTKTAQSALNNALMSAGDMGHTYIGSEHLLLGLMSDFGALSYKILESRGVTRERIYDIISANAGVGVKTSVSPSDFTPRARKIIEFSEYYARQGGTEQIGTEHILLAMADERDCVAMKVLGMLGIIGTELKNDVYAFLGDSIRIDKKGKGSAQSGKDKTAGTLLSYARDLTAVAKRGKIDPVIGRERETLRLMQILSRKSKNNPCLIGEPGVGKTAIVEGLAQKIAKGQVPDNLRGKSIYSLDLSLVVAGAKYRGEFEERMKNIMEEVSKNPSVILFIDELHTIIGAGAAEGAVDAANILKPALARGGIQIIGATTSLEYHKKIEKDTALERRFQSVYISEPSREETREILMGIRENYERHHNLIISEAAIDASIELSCRYISDRFLPDKAIDLLDEACSMMKIKGCNKPKKSEATRAELEALKRDKENAIIAQNFTLAASLHTSEIALRERLTDEERSELGERGHIIDTVTEREIAAVVSERTSIPVSEIDEDESERLVRLEDTLTEKIIGQGTAVRALTQAIQRTRLGLRDPRRPIGSFMFLGATGVGKTALARTLAEEYFGTKESFIKIDMSEYMEKHSVSKLIGAPPGYIGYDEGGLLTERVKRRPYSLILFDEIEKAHPEIFNILLQILDEGILTDSAGAKIDFKNTIIIMTSNVGAAKLTSTQKLGFGSADAEADVKRDEGEVMTELKRSFSPEFLNRVDEVIIFRRLSREDIAKITEVMLKEIKERIKKIGIDITFESSAIELIAEHGYDKVYGARPLQRTITHLVEDALCRKLLSGEICAPCSVTASREEDTLKFALSDS